MSKNKKKMIEIVNIDGGNLHIFWKTWEILMKFSGKLWIMTILKSKKVERLNLSLEDTFLEKPHGRGIQLDPASSFLSVERWVYLLVLKSSNDKIV